MKILLRLIYIIYIPFFIFMFFPPFGPLLMLSLILSIPYCVVKYLKTSATDENDFLFLAKPFLLLMEFLEGKTNQ